MSIYCGRLFGGGQGYSDKCGVTRGYSGKGDLDQCHDCQKKEIYTLRQFILGFAEFDAEIAYAYAALISSPENPS